MKKHTSLSVRQILVMAALLLAFSAMTLFLFSFRQDEKRFLNITSRLFVDEMTANTLNMHYSLAFPAEYGIQRRGNKERPDRGGKYFGRP